MNSFSAGCAKRSSQREGFTPVSHSSNAISLASCQPGVTRCTSFAISSKENRKNRCGYQCRHKRLHANQSRWMRQVFRKYRNQRAGNRQVSQCYPFKRAARRPRSHKLALEQYKKSSRLLLARASLGSARRKGVRAPRQCCFLLSVVLPLRAVHPALSEIFPAFVFTPQFADTLSAISLRLGVITFFSGIQRRIAQPRLIAVLSSSLEGFTAAGRPTASNSHRSCALSP